MRHRRKIGSSRSAFRRVAAVSLIAGLAISSLPAAAAGEEGAKLVGRAAPGWGEMEWIQGGPLAFDSMRGRVVLVRWWTGPGCPYCKASAPYLQSWHETYSKDGLVVVGLYHHKSSAPLTREHVEGLVETLGFEFPVAIDAEWRTIGRWWLDGFDRSFTSVSFLLDREGTIRLVHSGGSYSRDEADRIERLIKMMLGSIKKVP
jgi:thiol-disulfide isomerase/thioredoxin